LIFAGLQLSPGSPLAALSGGRPLTPEQQAALTERYHLDVPFFPRFLAWWADLLHGELGISVVQNDTVANLIGSRIGISAALVLMASALVIVIGIGLGLTAAFSPRWVEQGISWLTTIALATPPFFYAIVFITVFAVQLKWFPVFGGGEPGLDRVWHLTLPAVALALADCALMTRIVRNSAREEARREFVETARARGIPEGTIIRRHVLRNSLVPAVTIAGLTVAALVGGTAVIETVFGIDGIGSLLVTAATSKDYAVVQVLSLSIVAIFLLTNLVVDILYRFLDPRMSEAVTV
jgi:peptide/nickel transport system permease protein